MAEYDKLSLRDGCKKLILELDENALGELAGSELIRYFLLVDINIPGKFI